MKLRFLLALSLLLLGSAVYAAPAVQTTPATPAGDLSFLAPAAATPGCPAPALPFLAPAPTDRVDMCGSCSLASCRGHQTGSFCGFGSGGLNKFCQVADSCSSGGWTCYCGMFS
jgi:hypothetical protein